MYYINLCTDIVRRGMKNFLCSEDYLRCRALNLDSVKIKVDIGDSELVNYGVSYLEVILNLDCMPSYIICSDGTKLTKRKERCQIDEINVYGSNLMLSYFNVSYLYTSYINLHVVSFDETIETNVNSLFTGRCYFDLDDNQEHHIMLLDKLSLSCSENLSFSLYKSYIKSKIRFVASAGKELEIRFLINNKNELLNGLERLFFLQELKTTSARIIFDFVCSGCFSTTSEIIKYLSDAILMMSQSKLYFSGYVLEVQYYYADFLESDSESAYTKSILMQENARVVKEFDKHFKSVYYKRVSINEC